MRVSETASTVTAGAVVSFTTLVVSEPCVARRVGHADPDRVRAFGEVARAHGRRVLGRRVA